MGTCRATESPKSLGTVRFLCAIPIYHPRSRRKTTICASIDVSGTYDWSPLENSSNCRKGSFSMWANQLKNGQIWRKHWRTKTSTLPGDHDERITPDCIGSIGNKNMITNLMFYRNNGQMKLPRSSTKCWGTHVPSLLLKRSSFFISGLRFPALGKKGSSFSLPTVTNSIQRWS